MLYRLGLSGPAGDRRIWSGVVVVDCLCCEDFSKIIKVWALSGSCSRLYLVCLACLPPCFSWFCLMTCVDCNHKYINKDFLTTVEPIISLCLMFYHRDLYLMFPSDCYRRKNPRRGKKPTTGKIILPTRRRHQSFQLTNSTGTILSPDQENCQEDFPVLASSPH